MVDTLAPSREELVRRAAELVPLLRSRAVWIDENRRLPEDVIEAFEDSGILRMRAPARFGGFGSDARTLIDVHAELARGDSSAAFCVSVWSLINWIAGLYPDEVQDEVFAVPNARVCGTLAATGFATRANDGWTVSGQWRFNSGVLHSHWKLVVAVPQGADTEIGPLMALVPVSALEIIDDWHTLGLRGSGSVSTAVRDLFVPADRAIPVADFFQDQCKSKTNASDSLYQVPMLVTSTAATAGQVIGAAKGAMETFLERLPDRKITYTHYTSQREAPLTHLQVGEAALLTEEAELRARAFAGVIDDKARINAPWSEGEKVRSRVEMGRVALLGKTAVDIIAAASGGSSIYSDAPIQRIQRDIQTINLHALTSPTTNIELYGRYLCGLAPNTDYL